MGNLSRRVFIQSIAAAGLTAQMVGCDEEPGSEPMDGGIAGDPLTPIPEDASLPTQDGGMPRPLEIAMLIYPGMTALDMVAPQLCFAALGNVHLVWKDLTPVVSDSKLAIVPTTTLSECPEQLDILFVGGSSRSTWALLDDLEIVQFLASRGAQAGLVTSVCTGSLLLGAAGLLRGYRATAYWPVRPLLATLGATVVDERVVVDGNRVTGGGITAGMDFGLRVLEQLRGREFAELRELLFEYAPEPPFGSGTPALAPPAVLETATRIYGPQVALAREATERARVRLSLP